MSRYKCIQCGKKRDEKYLKNIPENLKIITGSKNNKICSKPVVRYREKPQCLDVFIKENINKTLIILSKLKDFNTAVNMSNSKGQNKTAQINLIEMIEEIEKNKK